MSDFTFDGFEPANTTPVPDVLFDKLLPHLNEAQIKVMLYIIRRTLGFKKTADAISLKQFRHGIKTKDGKQLDEGCGLKNYTTIVAALKYLEQIGCIESEKRETADGDQATTVYRIRFRGTALNVVPTTPNGVGVLRKTEDGTTPNGGRVLRQTEPQETVLQETVLQETEESTLPVVHTTPTPSSHDEDAHARLSSERTDPHGAHTGLPVLPSAPPTSTLDSGHTSVVLPQSSSLPIARGEGTTPPKQEKVTRKPRAPKPLIEEEARGPAPKPQMPDAAMVWGTRKCLLKFDAWREAKLIVRHKIIQASECAKALAETYTEEQVERVYAAMNADAYYVERGGADIFDVASNIAKYLKKLERKLVALPPIPSPSVPPGPRPLTDLQARNKALREKYGKSAVKEVAP